MSLSNNIKQRLHLYKKTFLKQSPELRLETFLQESVDLPSAILKFAKTPDEKNLLAMCEAIGDVETMIEVMDASFNILRPNIANIKKEKLINLEITNKKQGEINKLQENVDEKKKSLEEISKLGTKPESTFMKLIKSPARAFTQ